MRFTNEISVGAPADELFSFVSDVERVAPCLPGARIDGREGDAYRGSMRVKVGPITANYHGTLRFLELDASARRAVLRARADEAGGQGEAEARIETAIEETAGASRIRVDTDLQIRGRVAQFGRGAMERIAQRMFAEFAHNLEVAMASGGPATASAAPARTPAADAGARVDSGAGERDAAPRADSGAGELDAVRLVTGSLADRLPPALVPALIGFGYGYLLGKLRERAR